MFNKVVEVYRGDIIESSHCGHCVVVSAEGKILYQFGDPQTITYLRSSAKPFQVIPIIESGAAHRFKFSNEEIAIISGSHNGRDHHAKVVQNILDKIGLSESDLKCGIHIPHYYTANNIKPEPGIEFNQLHHNCSGKHAGMLALCVFKNLPIENYLEPSHPVQQIILDEIAKICDYPKEKIGIGIDGCSVPVQAMPLYNMALGFAHLVTPHSVSRDKAKTYGNIAQAMLDHPGMVAGEGRYDTDLMLTCKEKLIAKGGAEGLHCVGMFERGWGMAAKITDGAKRGIAPFSLDILRQLGIVTSSEIDSLKQYHHEIIYNWRDKEVGYLKPNFELKKINNSLNGK